MDKLPEGSVAVVYGLIANVVLLIWYGSWAWYRIRSHDSRLDKIEVRVEGHGEQLAKLMLDLSNRLERIETTLGILERDSRGRRNP